MEVDEGRSYEYAQDGAVDLKGRPVLKSKRVYEVFERMAYYGISTNLIIYLTKKLRQGTVNSANNVTNWVGTTWITPIVGAYIADAYLGRYFTFLLASFIYLSGMCLLTLSVSLRSLKPPPCTDTDVTMCSKASPLQLAVFYGALYTLAIGTGGTKPNISTIGADQFDDFDPKEKVQKLSFFNWWFFSIFFGTLFANTMLIYIQDSVGWTLGYALPTLGLAVSILIFLSGTPFYRHKLPSGSPFTRMARVIVAAFRKWTAKTPTDPKQFYELDLQEYVRKGKYSIDSSSTLRFLNKASVRIGTSSVSSSPWMLCTVTEVEETKQMLMMIPILLVTIIPSTMIAQTNTLFVKQGTTLDRHVGNFEFPPASLNAFVTISMLTCVVVYDRFFVGVMQRLTNNPRGITLLQRMGIGLVIHILIMVIAFVTERQRLRVARQHGVVEKDGEVPLSIFILLPQFVLMGCADAFLEVAKIEFFYDQAPESMKSLGTSYSQTSLGIGNFFSSFLLSMVSRLTQAGGHRGWILDNLNISHLDYYYAFFAVLNIINFAIFLVIAKFHVYKAEVSDSIKVLEQKLKQKSSVHGDGG
ncbi:protein NRT1/ PTR FAMILY 5.2-like isoform X2 [Prosopis cineraria]|uniref:protein NRT1/ PTR FAMILY 5.2-like isoform X2 n=1 Tax=Prosopis cineraria TaxID=364024 RepID=UPI00240EAB27|nr:protein NRT1/ PTR FAMILY 5.2-like isoform X2 [Prosopis cineraria]